MVKNIKPGLSGSRLVSLERINDTLFFIADDGIRGRELWKSDGTEPGTILVKDIAARPDGSNPEQLTELNSALFFAANGGQLWKSDGTSGGTVLIKQPTEIYFSTPGSIQDLTVVGDKMLFVLIDKQGNQWLWRSDGTESGTYQVTDPNDNVPDLGISPR